MTIHAMLFTGTGQSLRRTELPRPELQPGEALVRLRVCTLCGSDLHTFFGRRTEPTPCILGHEMVGTLEELGPGPALRTICGEELHVGDRITWSVATNCGSCYLCQRDWPQKCATLRKYGHIAVRDGVGLHGGLATHCHLLPRTAIVRVPDEIPDELAAPAMCATATASAAIRQAAVALSYSDPTALVVGAGLLGCTVTALLKVAGVQVLVTDFDPHRLQQAKFFGAAETATPEQLNEVLQRFTKGRVVDASFEISGSLAGVEAAYRAARIGGTVVLVGTVSPTPSLALMPEQVVRRCLTIRGLHNYAPQNLVDAVEFLRLFGHEFPFQNLGPRFPLAEAQAAFHYAEANRPARVIIDCLA